MVPLEIFQGYKTNNFKNYTIVGGPRRDGYV